MKQKLIYTFWVFCFLCFHLGLIAQSAGIKGRVIDSDTKKPLPFVNIVYDDNNKGLTSDIDGCFLIKDKKEITFLKFSYVGYYPVMISKHDLENDSLITVKMEVKTFNINEVKVFPDENPAHRIINKVVENRNINNPENLSSYSYTSYHKMYFTADIENRHRLSSDSTNLDSLKKEPGFNRAKKFLDSQHLFMMETISERKYKRPGKINENVLATRVSGFKEPSFIMLATQMQSFSFYNDMITLMESRYVNPISRGSTNRYFFNIEDTTISASGDTVYSISFRPKKGKNFEGLKGVFNINTHGYAIQNVIAEPIEQVGMMNVKIQQNYDLIDNKTWFPKELNTDIIFSDIVRAEAGKQKMVLVGVGKSYITDIEVNKELRNEAFSAIEVEVDESAFYKNDTIWNQYRKDSLSRQELRTYESIDSIGKEHKFDFKLKLFKTLSTGYIPFHFIDIQVLSLLDFNVYEGFRPGFGLRTNNKISEYFSVGGYTAYGFNDKQWKFGASLNIKIAPRQEVKLGFSYKNDVEESSGYQFFEEKEGLNSTEAYRYFFINDMTYKTSYTGNVEFRTLKHWKINLFANSTVRKNTSDYYFTNENIISEPFTSYHFQEAGIQLKFAPNESKAYVAGELLTTNPVSSPVLFVNFIKGFKNQKSDFEYAKLEVKFNINFLTKTFGRTYIQMVGAKVIGNMPYFMLYNGHGSYYDFTVETANSFATMRMNEFLSDEFVSLHFRQDFGSLIFKTKNFKPDIVLATSIGFGQLHKPTLHNGIDFKTMEKGFYESGVMINSIYKQLGFMGYGFGVFYRYSSYSYSNNSDNFAYKLTLTFKL
ncbi:MAG: DUF5686 family protein [Bacteroidales bacterium]|nr:DUF5686 family protein [Bacteroidales bacterium]